MSACEVAALLPALCFVDAVGWPSSSPPNGRPVLLVDVLGRGGPVGLVPVVPVALGRHGRLGRCVAPSWWGVLRRCLAFLLVGPVLRGRKVLKIGTTAEKSFEIWYDTPCPAPEAALQAQPIILYIAVPFGFPFSFACADRMYTPVGGRAPSVLFGAPPCSPWEPRGAVPARWCGVCACARRPVALALSAGCRARRVPRRAVLRGSGGVCVGASVRLPEARVA